MRKVKYIKPSMTNLKGKKGKAILAEIRSMDAKPLDDIRREADECMKRILARRKKMN